MFEFIAELIAWFMGDIASLVHKPGKNLIARCWPALIMGGLSVLILIMVVLAYYTEIRPQSFMDYFLSNPVGWAASIACISSLVLFIIEYMKKQ